MSEVKERDKVNNATIYDTTQGVIRIVHYAKAFGEPAGDVHVSLIKPNGYFEGERVMNPDEAIEFAKELIRRAKLVKKSVRIWKKEGVKASIVWADEAIKLGYHQNV